MDNSTVIGLVAAGLTVIAFLLPMIRILRLGSAQAIPLPTMVVALVGTVLWFVYGLVLGLLSLILAGAIMSLLIILVLVMKFRSGSPLE